MERAWRSVFYLMAHFPGSEIVGGPRPPSPQTTNRRRILSRNAEAAKTQQAARPPGGARSGKGDTGAGRSASGGEVAPQSGPTYSQPELEPIEVKQVSGRNKATGEAKEKR